eukprot:TRINITY_DN73026_c0_g1_i2.p1 TRINITY_DN73026_c0_g1~~TRINITY_DN73026_c0_g1_i2.p1  ORF type:complete len:454 (-),score=92.91 TRINITY_DN73026_c0_g1_i2:80-1363(-)
MSAPSADVPASGSDASLRARTGSSSVGTSSGARASAPAGRAAPAAAGAADSRGAGITQSRRRREDRIPSSKRTEKWYESGSKAAFLILTPFVLWHFHTGWERPSFEKTPDEVRKLRNAGGMAAELLQHLSTLVRPNMTTGELDAAAASFIEERGATAAPLLYGGLLPGRPPSWLCRCWGYAWYAFIRVVGVAWADILGAGLPLCGFPGSICVSVNEVVCHGIPGPQRLQEGDIVNLDVTVIVDGYYGDSSLMVLVGGPPGSFEDADELASSSSAERFREQVQLGRVARESLFAGLQEVRAGAHLGDIGAAVAAHAHANGFSVVRTFGGHGIGRRFHEPPHVQHVGKRGTGLKLEVGMVFTVEPMLNSGTDAVRVEPDMWTIRTADGSLSAQWEHMVLVLADGCEVLTWRQGEEPPRLFPLERQTFGG